MPSSAAAASAIGDRRTGQAAFRGDSRFDRRAGRRRRRRLRRPAAARDAAAATRSRPSCTTSALRTTSSFTSIWKFAGAAHVLEQVDQVVAVENAGGRREPARQVGVADDVDAVPLDHCPGHGQRAVAALLGGEIDDHRARLHAPDHVLGDQDRRRRLGISAVVMMMSTSLACAANSAISAAMNAGLISFA